MKHLLFGLLLGLIAVFPHQAGQGAALTATAAVWAAGKPLLWAFAAGLILRPRLARHLPRRTP